MIYLHVDKKYRPDQWYRRFQYLLETKDIPFEKVNLLRKDFRRLKPEGNGLIGRFGHKRKDLQRMRPIHEELVDFFGGRVFPGKSTYHYYDDKRRQRGLFAAGRYPTPQAAYVESHVDLDRFLEESGLRFPLVSKRLYGAGSAQVKLARRAEDVLLPGMVQEFCRGNQGDVRIVVIGHRVMGFFRRNRPGDFRASGSGLIEYLAELDAPCVRIAYEISQQNDFESMSYDFVRDNQRRWVVLECSYTYVDAAVRDCRYYYEMPGGEKRDKAGVYPEDFILEDFLDRHPQVATSRRRARWIAPPFRLVRHHRRGMTKRQITNT